MNIRTGKMSNSPFKIIQEQIEAAKTAKKPYDHLVKKQIQLLEDAHDEFIKNVKDKGLDMQNVKVGQIEISQYSAMRQLAESIGLSVEKYDNLIAGVQKRLLGEANYTKFFKQD